MKRLFKFRYPKLTLLIVIIGLSYFLFTNSFVQDYFLHLGNLSYLGVFIAGLLFSFGFTTPFSIGIFIAANPENLLLAGLIGAVGATISDIILFHIIRFSFMDEFKRLEKNKEIKIVEDEFALIPVKLKHYLLYTFTGIVIASPLPDEVGVMMLAGLSHINANKLAMIAITLHFIGISAVLLI